MSAPNLREVEWAISELEKEESSKEGYKLLASLYTIRQHMQESTEPEPPRAVSARSASRAESYGESEFLQSISGKNTADVMEVLDEHMEVMRVINPRAYESVIRKLNKL